MRKNLEDIRDKIDEISNLLHVSHEYTENYIDIEEFAYTTSLTKIILSNTKRLREDLSLLCDSLP